MGWLDSEIEALRDQHRRGEIPLQEYLHQVRLLRRDAQEQEDRESIRAAGRGHLLRD